MRLHPFPCVAHVHSTYSDGTATVPEILDAARTAGARGVLLTDHDTLGARRDGWEGWHDGVLLVVGHEISPKHGHFLAFGLDAEVGHEGRSEEEICSAVVRAGGVGFAAHPFSSGSRMSRTIAPPHSWRALDSCPEAGIELWSLTTDTAEGWASPREAWRGLREPEAALVGPPPEHLATWDALGRVRRVPAIGGLDAHQPGIRWRGRVRTIMPHARWFGLLQTLVLLEEEPTGDAVRDIPALLGALREGRALLACPVRARAEGFSFGARGAGGRELAPGTEARAGEWELTVRSPRPAELVLLRDGQELARAERAEELTARACDPGVYRAEARLDGRTWVLTNPVYVR